MSFCLKINVVQCCLHVYDCAVSNRGVEERLDCAFSANLGFLCELLRTDENEGGSMGQVNVHNPRNSAGRGVLDTQM